MSIYLYEQSLVESLRKVTGDKRIHVIPPEQSILYLAEFNKDKVVLPAILLSRNSMSLTDTRNQVAALKGETTRLEKDATVVKAQVVPVKIEWSLDVYAADRITCDEIIRELVFYFIQHPCFKIRVPYNLDIEQEFSVFLSDDIQDNSDLVEFPNHGEVFRETLTLYTDDAHFYSSSQQYPTYIHLVDVGYLNKSNQFNKGDE